MTDEGRTSASAEGQWIVSNPQGQDGGPYTLREIEHWVQQGRIELDGEARHADGRVMTVRKALDSERLVDDQEATSITPVYCPACRRAGSPEADYCPYCGSPVSRHARQQQERTARDTPMVEGWVQAKLPINATTLRHWILPVGGIVLICIGALSPWMKASLFSTTIFSANGIQTGWGTFSMLCSFVAIAVFYSKARGWRVWIAMASAALATAFPLCFFIACLANNVEMGFLAIGWIMTLIGGASLTAACVMTYGKPPSTLVGAFSFAIVSLFVVSGFMNSCVLRGMPGNIASSTAQLWSFPGTEGPREDTLQKMVSAEWVYYWKTSTLGGGWFIVSADPGRQFFVVRVRVNNLGDRTLDASADSFGVLWQCEASDKNIYNQHFSIAPDSRIIDLKAQMRPGGQAEGDVVFEMPSSVRPVEVMVSPEAKW